MRDLEDCVNNIRNHTDGFLYNPGYLRRLISRAERNNIDVTAYKDMLPELDAIYIKGEIAYSIMRQRQKPGDYFYNPTEIRKLIEKGKELNVDVSEFEVQLPELDVIYIKGRIDDNISFCMKDPGLASLFINDIRGDIKRAQEMGIDVSEREEKFCKLKKKLVERKIQKWREAR